jgi:hypothetical protein
MYQLQFYHSVIGRIGSAGQQAEEMRVSNQTCQVRSSWQPSCEITFNHNRTTQPNRARGTLLRRRTRGSMKDEASCHGGPVWYLVSHYL